MSRISVAVFARDERHAYELLDLVSEKYLFDDYCLTKDIESYDSFIMENGFFLWIDQITYGISRKEAYTYFYFCFVKYRRLAEQHGLQMYGAYLHT